MSDRRFRELLTWEEKARRNPLYAVMSVSEFEGKERVPTQEDLDAFFAEGRRKAKRYLLPWLSAQPRTDTLRVLEFGCGMGRLLSVVQPEVASCAGVDISETMIDIARDLLPDDVELHVLDRRGKFPFPDASFDAVYSYAVFQHIRRKSVVLGAIEEISRVLKPGGLVKINFHMVYPPSFRTRWYRAGDSFAFERFSIVYGFAKRLPIWRVRAHRHNNWSGARLGHGQISRAFRQSGIQVYGIEAGPDQPEWFYGIKT